LHAKENGPMPLVLEKKYLRTNALIPLVPLVLDMLVNKKYIYE